ncbi:hypothetical protein GOODEAATRI_008175 [Goodea atripinnis]|uniref:Uncharacterized protein n=1 Tax=Goodea atripinnis TaxID=208336 RepID=A0ABV0P2I0_9TELE
MGFWSVVYNCRNYSNRIKTTQIIILVARLQGQYPYQDDGSPKDVHELNQIYIDRHNLKRQCSCPLMLYLECSSSPGAIAKLTGTTKSDFSKASTGQETQDNKQLARLQQVVNNKLAMKCLTLHICLVVHSLWFLIQQLL